MNIDDLYLSTNSNKPKVFIVYVEIPDEYATVSAYENKAAFATEEKAGLYITKLIEQGHRKYSVGYQEMELQ